MRDVRVPPTIRPRVKRCLWAEHFSGLLRNPYPIGQKEARGARWAAYVVVDDRMPCLPVLTELEHPGLSLDPHA